MKSSPKVTIIGAGSLFFGRQAIWQMVHSPVLNTGTLALVDTDAKRLKKLEKLARMVIEHTGVALKLEVSTDRREVLKGSDFVVLSFARDTVRYRGLDCEISERYGIRMCSGDTIGPGGVFRAMRELPVILDCARDIRDLCPQAWVINYINPSSVNGIAMTRVAPDLNSFALCDSLHMPHVKRAYAERAGIVPQGTALTAAQDAAPTRRRWRPPTRASACTGSSARMANRASMAGWSGTARSPGVSRRARPRPTWAKGSGTP